MFRESTPVIFCHFSKKGKKCNLESRCQEQKKVKSMCFTKSWILVSSVFSNRAEQGAFWGVEYELSRSIETPDVSTVNNLTISYSSYTYSVHYILPWIVINEENSIIIIWDYEQDVQLYNFNISVLDELRKENYLSIKNFERDVDFKGNKMKE